MVFKLLEEIVGYFRDKPYWSKLRPLFTLISLYLIAAFLAYQFIEWQYGIRPTALLYLRSYLFKQISLIFLAVGVVGLLFSFQRKSDEGASVTALGLAVRQYSSDILKRAALIALVAAILGPVYLYLSPRAVGNIRIKFMKEPPWNKYALVYLIYELNKTQRNWYFEVDFDVFSESQLTSAEREKCAGEDQFLCYAKTSAKGDPLIAITTEQLGEDFFWKNDGNVSVVSTFDWDRYAPPSTYEFLVYSIVVQSILIHLNSHCSGLPQGAFKESRIGYGDLFQFAPRRNAMKASILAAHLSPKGEELLFNCFGAEYLSACSKLLSLEWLHSGKVAQHLETSFGVKL